MSFRLWSRWLVALALLPLLPGTACRRDSGTDTGNGAASRASGSARFAVPNDLPTGNGVRETGSVEPEPFRLTNQFSILQSELSPAVVVHSETAHLTLFGGLTNAGLSAPKFVAWATPNGPRSFQRGETLDVSVMAENWMLVWWAGAEGWTNWDCPWVVYLQHKPDTLTLDADGLHMDFPKRAGDVVMMPLYGYEKLPLENFDFRATHKLPALKVPIKTWEWAKVIPRDPLTRLRYWGAALRGFPVRVDETFKLGADGTLTVKSRFQRMPIASDWRGRHVKLAPVSPALALAAKVGGFPVRFSERWFDLEMPTPFGPVFGIEDVDEYEATLPVPRYVEEGFEVNAILERLRTYFKANGTVEAERVLGKFAESLRRSVVDWSSLPEALPLAIALGRTNEVAILRSFIERSTATGVPSAIAEVTPEALWAYVNFTGDATIVKAAWPTIKGRFSKPAPTGWTVSANSGASSLAASVGRTLAVTRLARLAGDIEAYQNGCVAMAGGLVGLFIQERGSEYFHEHQPWHAMESFPKRGSWLSLSGLDGGWDLGGRDGRVAGQNQLRRWSGAVDADIAGFFEDVRSGALTQSGNVEASVFWKAMVSASGGTTNGLVAREPRRGSRLFPSGASESFRLPSEPGAPKSGMAIQVSTGTPSGVTARWPQLVWSHWKTPTGAPWTFGEIRPVKQGLPKSSRVVALSGANSRVFEYDLGR